MKKKNVLRAVIFSAIMIVAQVGVDLMRHTAINWIEVLVGAGIVFLISIGSKSTIEIAPSKKGKEQSAKAEENAASGNNMDKNANVSKDNGMNKDANEMSADMNDLRFYAYNRIAIISLCIGVGCILYGSMGQVVNSFWLYLVGGFSLVQAIVFFVLYLKKRNEFVEKAKKTQKRR